MQRSGWGIGSVIAATLLVAACSTSSGATTAPASAAPGATTPVTAAAALPAGVFTGHWRCSDTPLPSASPNGEGLSGVTCEVIATDPRMSGTSVGTYKIDGSHPMVTAISGDSTLTNSGGSWVCQTLILGEAGGAGGSDEICGGRGGYAGLTAYTHGVSGNDATDFGIVGWIEGD